MDSDELFLEIKRSTIPHIDAGNGVFAKEDIPMSQIVAEYRGSIIDLSDTTFKDFWGPTIMQVPGKARVFIKGHSVGATINDCVDITKEDHTLPVLEGFTHNCLYSNFGHKVMVISTRPIKKGEELFVPYGPEYWKGYKFHDK